jgi:hypothetical protein
MSKDRGDARTDHFEGAEEGAPIDVVRGQAPFHGPDDVVEPLVQRGAVAEPAHQDHGGVAMDVGERGQDGLAGAIEGLRGLFEGGNLDFGRDFGQNCRFGSNIAVFGLRERTFWNEQIHGEVNPSRICLRNQKNEST